MSISPFKQYIDLARAYGPQLEAGAAGAFNALRPEALEALQQALEHDADPRYIYSGAGDYVGADMGVNLMRQPFSGNVDVALRHDVPLITPHPVVVANDYADPAQEALRHLPAGITVCTLRQLEATGGALSDEVAHIIAQSNPHAGAMEALGLLLAQDALVVYAEPGARPERPVQIVQLLTATQPVMAVRRLIVVAGTGACLSLMASQHTHPDCAPSAALQHVAVVCHHDAKVNFITLDSGLDTTAQHTTVEATVDHGATLHLWPLILAGGTTRLEVNATLHGRDAAYSLHGMGITSHSQVAEVTSNLRHQAPGCTSEQLFKFVCRDQSRAAFNGLIYVGALAHGTKARQYNRNVIIENEATDNARGDQAARPALVHSQPQLEIYCDDVEAQHGTATGQLDASALFYMRQRGIPLAQARNMLLQAFMADVLAPLPVPALAERLRTLVERRINSATDPWEAGDNLCNQCGAC